MLFVPASSSRYAFPRDADGQVAVGERRGWDHRIDWALRLGLRMPAPSECRAPVSERCFEGAALGWSPFGVTLPVEVHGELGARVEGTASFVLDGEHLVAEAIDGDLRPIACEGGATLCAKVARSDALVGCAELPIARPSGCD